MRHRAFCWATRAKRVLNLSRSRSTISLLSSICTQKYSSEFHALSFHTITRERKSTPMDFARSRSTASSSQLCQRFECRNHSTVFTTLKRWLFSDQTQGISEASLPGDHLCLPALCSVNPLQIILILILHNGSLFIAGVS